MQRDINGIQTLIFMQRLCTYLLILKYLDWIKREIKGSALREIKGSALDKGQYLHIQFE